MKDKKIKEVMIALSDYATISEGETLGTAIKTLKEARDDTRYKYKHRAVLVYDKDKNIVELIARKDLDNQTEEAFGPEHFLCISEIGMPTDDIRKKYDMLHELCGIGIHDGNFERFCAMGDPNGLFICIDKNVKDWFPTNDKAYSSEFELTFIEQGAEYRVAFRQNDLRKSHSERPSG